MIQDVRVIAYPVPKNDGVLLNGASGTVRSVPALPGIGRLADGDTLTSVRLPVGKTAIVFESPDFYRPQHHRTSGTPPDRSECRPRGFGRERLPAGGGVRYQSVQRNAQCRVRCLCSRYDLFPGHVFPGVPPFGR